MTVCLKSKVLGWAAVFMTGVGATAGTPCVDPTDPQILFWANDCNSPTIIVSYNGVEGVAFSFSNGRWTLVVATAAWFDDWISVDAHATSSGVDIEEISVVKGSEPGAVSVAVLTFPEFDTPAADLYRFRDVRSVRRGSGVAELYLGGAIAGDLGVTGVNATPDVTGIGTEKILDFEGLTVGGDVLGNIILSAGDDELFESSSQLKRVTVSGSILGHVKAPSSSINTIDAQTTIGTPTSPIEIASYSTMNQIRGGEIHATITPGSLGPAKSLLRYLETTGLNGTSGDFIGTIDASEIGVAATAVDGLLIKGNFGSASTPSIVKVEEPLGGANDHLAVRIGGSFLSPTPGGANPSDFYSRFELPTDGLVGRMIINSEDDSGVWHSEAKIEVGTSQVLDDPLYNIPRASVGGGVVGLAPFEIYTVESKGVPGNGIVLFDWGSGFGPGSTIPPDLWECEPQTPEDVVLQFYGGVEQTFPGTSDRGWPVSIWSNAENVLSPGDMQEITNKFSFSFQTIAGRGYLKISRTTGSYETSGSYEIRYDKNAVDDYQSGIPALQKRGGLTLQDVTGSPRQESFIIGLARVNKCKLELLLSFDLNTDGDLCTQDVAEWMNNPVDLNGDETTCSQDVARLVQAINLYNSLD